MTPGECIGHGTTSWEDVIRRDGWVDTTDCSWPGERAPHGREVGYLLDKRASSSQSKDFTVDVESFLVRQGRRFVPRVRVDGFSQSVEVDYRVDGDNFNQLYLWVFDPARHKRQTERANTIALGYTDITRGVETGEGLRKARFAVIVNSQRDKLAPSANDDAMRILRSYLPNVATWETRHEIDELLAA